MSIAREAIFICMSKLLVFLGIKSQMEKKTAPHPFVKLVQSLENDSVGGALG
jgi:hypothetical protein